MPFILIFGLILTLIGFAVKNLTLKEVNKDLCPSLQKEQEQDIRQNKKSSKSLMIIGGILAIVGLIGVLL